MTFLGLLVSAAPSSSAQGHLFESRWSMLPPQLWDTVQVRSADLDRDGHPDLLLLASGALRLWRNEGYGSFADRSERLGSTSFAPPTAIAHADVDGDQDFDIYVGTGAADLILENLGNASFRELPNALPAEMERPVFVHLQDLDGDRDADALLGFSSGGTVLKFMRNDGTGRFAEAPGRFPAGGSVGARSVAVGDIDGDGDADVISTSAFGGSFWINDGSGVFSDGRGRFPSNLPGSISCELFDADADRDLDLVIPLNPPRLYLNDGRGFFTEAPSTRFPGITQPLNGSAAADVDADGDLDIVFLVDGGQNLLFRNDGSGSFQLDLAALPIDSDESQVATWADVDADSDLDLIVGNRRAQDRLYLNDGRGYFRNGSAWPALANGVGFGPIRAIRTGDLDGDGDLDLVLGTDSRPEAFANNGAGEFEPLSLPVPLNRSSNGIAIGDLDGDGDRDLAFCGQSWPWTLLLNAGQGRFTDASSQIPATSNQRAPSVAIGDFDADGDLDLIGARSGGFEFLENDGAAQFTLRLARFSGGRRSAGALSCGDVDGDGDLDLAAGNMDWWFAQPNEPPVIYLNRGNGFFDVSPHFPTAVTYTHGLALVDIDGDTDLDLLTANGSRDRNRLYRNDGSGRFLEAAGSLPQQAVHSIALGTGDVDGDGHVDVIFGTTNFGSVPQPALLYLNNGDGTFRDESSRFWESSASVEGLAIADLDGERDLDVVSAYGRKVYQLSNRTQQLAWNALPRLGKDLVFELDGPALSPYCLASAPAGGVWSLPGLGELRLDPSTLWIFGEGALDAAGEGEVRLHVPLRAELLDLPVFFQALVGRSPRFTNLEIARATRW